MISCSWHYKNKGTIFIILQKYTQYKDNSYYSFNFMYKFLQYTYLFNKYTVSRIFITYSFLKIKLKRKIHFSFPIHCVVVLFTKKRAALFIRSTCFVIYALSRVYMDIIHMCPQFSRFFKQPFLYSL